MKKNDILTLTITDQSATGEGIGKSDGFPFFVKDAIIGDTIKAGITKWKKTYGYARLISIVEPSPFRVEPRCAHARRCGGCQIQAMDYARQLKYKEDAVANALMRIGHMSEEEVKACMRPIVGMDEPWRYRNKSQYPIGRGEDGEPIAGYYAARSHRIVPHTECAIGHESDKYFLDCILTWMKECDIPAYDEESGEGIVRHAVLRHGYRSGEHMVCLVVNLEEDEELPHAKELKERLSGICDAAQTETFVGEGTEEEKKVAGEERTVSDKEHKVAGTLTSLAISRNTRRDNVILGASYESLLDAGERSESFFERQRRKKAVSKTGREELEDAAQKTEAGFHDRIDGIDFAISPLSFFQINSEQMEKLYALVKEGAKLSGREIVWDLFCGIGTISLYLARDAKEVHGIEIVPQAIEDAANNAVRNKIRNARFYCGAAESIAHRELADKRPDVVVLDPPRKGCEPFLLSTIAKAEPERIVYVSCNPATLARDLTHLREDGYQVESVTPVDMFPHTVHVETVVCLGNKNAKPKDYVEIGVDAEDYYRIKDSE